jgi:hypothetical protein
MILGAAKSVSRANGTRLPALRWPLTGPERNEGQSEFEPFGPDEGPWHSFPSGHPAGSVAVVQAVGRAYPQARTVAYAEAAAVAPVQIPRGRTTRSILLSGLWWASLQRRPSTE